MPHVRASILAGREEEEVSCPSQTDAAERRGYKEWTTRATAGGGAVVKEWEGAKARNNSNPLLPNAVT